MLAAACFSLFWPACQHADPKATPLSASAPQPSSLAKTAGASTAALAATSAAPLATASAPPDRAEPPRKRIDSVLIVGDSLSDEKVGGGGFVKLLRQRCPSVAFDNRAKGGFMVNQMRKRLETEILPEGRRYSHAIVFGGVNDLYSDQTANRTLTRIEADLSRIYEDLRQRGVQVIAITVSPWGGYKRWYTPERGQNTLTLNAWIGDQAPRGNVAETLDSYPLLSCGAPELLCPELALPFKDGLHFGKLGHEKLGEALMRGPFRDCQ
jgi:lysophospholipase L1-like esterase